MCGFHSGTIDTFMTEISVVTDYMTHLGCGPSNEDPVQPHQSNIQPPSICAGMQSRIEEDVVV